MATLATSAFFPATSARVSIPLQWPGPELPLALTAAEADALAGATKEELDDARRRLAGMIARTRWETCGLLVLIGCLYVPLSPLRDGRVR